MKVSFLTKVSTEEGTEAGPQSKTSLFVEHMDAYVAMEKDYDRTLDSWGFDESDQSDSHRCSISDTGAEIVDGAKTVVWSLGTQYVRYPGWKHDNRRFQATFIFYEQDSGNGQDYVAYAVGETVEEVFGALRDRAYDIIELNNLSLDRLWVNYRLEERTLDPEVSKSPYMKLVDELYMRVTGKIVRTNEPSPFRSWSWHDTPDIYAIDKVSSYLNFSEI